MTILIISNLILILISSLFCSRFAIWYIGKYWKVDTDGNPVKIWPIEQLIPIGVLFSSLYISISSYRLFLGAFPKVVFLSLFLGCFITVLSLIDIQSKVLPSKIIYGSGGSFLLLAFGSSLQLEFVLNLFYMGVSFFCAFIIIFILSRNRFGFGDVRFSFLLGLFYGLYIDFSIRNFIGGFSLFVVLYSLIYVIHGVMNSKIRKTGFFGEEVPLGPSLGIGVFILTVLPLF